MGAESSLRDSLDTADPNRLASALQVIGFGDLLTLLIEQLTPTESGLSVTDDAITLGDQPTPHGVFQVNVKTSGDSGTGVKKLRRGTASDVPVPGECVWDGALTIKFAPADEALTVDVTYALADLSNKASVLLARLEKLG